MQEINDKVGQKTGFCQWRDSQSVINWFDEISTKKKKKSLKFDIVDFYPSITKSLLIKSLEYAKTHTDICDEQVDIIMHARKSLLFDSSGTWIKKNDNDLFDVTQGSYDGAEVCETVGLFLLSMLEERFGKGYVGLYRDDGLALLPYSSGPAAERSRKDIVKIFDSVHLKITTETNLTSTDFLDNNLDLKNN